MKVLQVNKLYAPWIGGIEHTVKQLAETLTVKHDMHVDVLCSVPKGRGKKEQHNGITVFRSGSVGMFLQTPISLQFFSLFRKYKDAYDVIDIHHPSPLAFLALYFFRPKGRVVIHYHSDIVKQKIAKIFFSPIVHAALRIADTIIVSSENLISSSPVLQKYKEKCTMIPFGIHVENVRSRVRTETVAALQKQYGKFTLFVGRLAYYKGVSYLIRAMASIEQNLVIIGEGSDKASLMSLAEELGVADRVFFLPHQEADRLVSFFAAAHAFVLPSIHRSEAFGLVLLEAMVHGTPAISTELHTGTSFVNTHMESGFVVQPRNVDELAQRLRELYESEALYKKLSDGAASRVDALFREETMMEAHKAVYLNTHI